jgi:CHAD domain-containing protein
MEAVKFELGDSSDLKKELLLTLEQQWLYIIGLCEALPDDAGNAIHEVRRTFKKNRSLLKLIRDSMGYSMYFRENEQMRDLHRMLSPARDADVLYELLSELPEKDPGLQGQAWYHKTLELSASRRDRERDRLIRDRVPSKISRGARQCIDRQVYYLPEGEGFTLIEDGIRRIYRQGKASMKDAMVPDAEAARVHLFRRKSKYLQYQITYLKPLFPELLKPTSKTLKKLTDSLGAYNDYSQALKQLPGLLTGIKISQDKMQELLLGIRAEMRLLQVETECLSQKLYAEKTGRFTSRMRSYWEQFELKNQNLSS